MRIAPAAKQPARRRQTCWCDSSDSEESRDVVVAFGDAAALPVPWMMARTGQRLRCDVLVDVEEIAGIVRPLELNQAVVVLAVVVSNPAEIVVLHEVDVAAGLRIRRQCLVVVA